LQVGIESTSSLKVIKLIISVRFAFLVVKKIALPKKVIIDVRKDLRN